MDYTDDQIVRILLEQLTFTAKELCAKWHLTPSQLRAWKKKFSASAQATTPDLIVLAIHGGGWHAPADLIGWLDARDHARYSAAEVAAMFEKLAAQGEAERDGDRWRYVQVEPPYLFGPRNGPSV